MKKVSIKLQQGALIIIFLMISAGKALFFKAGPNSLRFHSILMLYGHWSETAHRPIPLVNTNICLSLRPKCWLTGEVMGRNL